MVGWQHCGSNPPEILPLRTRTKETSLATSTSFLGNFLVLEITPTGFEEYWIQDLRYFCDFQCGHYRMVLLPRDSGSDVGEHRSIVC